MPRVPAAAFALFVAGAALLAAALFLGGGSSDGRVAWIGAGAVLAALIACVAALFGLLSAPGVGREGLAFAGLAAGFVVWNGLSIVWSAAPDRSWAYFNRGLVYLAFAVVGAFVASVAPPRALAWLLGSLITAACLWGLAGKAVPALYQDGARFARLRSPLGYWNALAVVAAFGLPLALWAATHPRHGRLVRAAAVASLYALVVALFLTYSRGGILVALVGVGLWLALSEPRFEGVVALVEALLPAAVVLAVAFSLPGVSEDGQLHEVRVQDGAWFALAFVFGAALTFTAAYLIEYRPEPARRRLLLRIAAAGTAAVLVLGVGVVASRGNPLRGDVVGSQSSRLGEFGSNNRWTWWKEAWQGFEDRPVVGTGAASFELLHRKLRTDARDLTTEPHSLPLQVAAELGLVGLALAAAAVAAALLGAARALRRLDGEDRAAAAALACLPPILLVHGLLDFDWDFVGLCGPVLFVIGFLLATGRPATRLRRRPFWALGAVLVAWGSLYSIAAPRLAATRVNDAYAEIERGSVEDAVAAARSAHSLNPLSIEPLQAWAAAEESRGRLERARELYVQAVDLQPLNWEAWYELGRFEADVLVDTPRARRDLQRARELDPYGPAG